MMFLPILGLLASAIVWWYFGVLLARTDFLVHGTNIATSTIHIMYATCAVAIALGLLIGRRRQRWRRWRFAILLIALIPSIGRVTEKGTSAHAGSGI